MIGCRSFNLETAVGRGGLRQQCVDDGIGPVLDDNRLPQGPGDFLRHHARGHIDGAAAPRGNNPYGLGRKRPYGGLRP